MRRWWKRGIDRCTDRGVDSRRNWVRKIRRRLELVIRRKWWRRRIHWADRETGRCKWRRKRERRWRHEHGRRRYHRRLLLYLLRYSFLFSIQALLFREAYLVLSPFFGLFPLGDLKMTGIMARKNTKKLMPQAALTLDEVRLNTECLKNPGTVRNQTSRVCDVEFYRSRSQSQKCGQASGRQELMETGARAKILSPRNGGVGWT